LRAAAAAVLAAVCVAVPTALAAPASAKPATPPGAGAHDPIVRAKNLLAWPTAPDGAKIVSAKLIADNRTIVLEVYSTAMARRIVVGVQRPADPSVPRPALYLLNGAGGGIDTDTWAHMTSVLKFLGTKNVNVVEPLGGAFSYYADWREKDPFLGINKWNTFLTKELPPLIDGALGTSRVNAIAGMSMSGTSVLALAETAPTLYRSVAAYSGCAQIADPVGYRMVNLTTELWGGGNTKNMYGPADDPMWAANDPYIHADRLRGINLFLSSGSGLPGQYDVLNGPYDQPGVKGMATQILLGGVIEAGVNYCTHNMMARLDALDIPATYDFPATGTHSWGYWQDAMHQSWPVLAKGLGLSD
jgi:S-formylglutathione hydrolase FrmB